jgi:hypothetical protein
MQKHKVTLGTKFHLQEQNSAMHEATLEEQSRSMHEVTFEKHKVVLCIKLHLKNIKSFYA